MPFEIPTPQALREQNYAEIEANLPSADPRLEKSFLNTLARMNALSTHGLYLYLDWLFKQIFVESADAEYLERHGSPIAIERNEATTAKGMVTVTGQAGGVVLPNAELVRGDGVRYVSHDGGTLSGESMLIEVESVDFGDIANADAEILLSFVESYTGVDTEVQVDTDGLTGGVDRESDEDYRARILTRKRQPPHGGAQFDYTSWALEVPGVTRAWTYPKEDGAGTVRVRFMMDDSYTDGIPQAADILTVQDYINGPYRRPVTADLIVSAPVAHEVDFDITISPDTPEIRAAVEDELADLIERNSQPGATLLISQIRAAVSAAAGEVDNVVNLPTANVDMPTIDEIPVMGTINWTL